MTIHEFLSRFDKVKATGGQFLVRCPAHADNSPSLAVKEGSDGSILLNCYANCSIDSILSSMCIELSDLFPTKDDAPKKTIVAEYIYQDEQGTILYKKIRYSPKSFSQCRPDGNGGWIYNLTGVRKIVYRLPELLGQKAILFVEGCKDVDAAWKIGIPATCNPDGAGKWLPEYGRMLVTQGVQRVAVIPDNDPPGIAHANTVAAGLQQVGIEVRMVPLPDLGAHGDLSDYLATGKTRADLLEIIKKTPLWTRTEPVHIAIETKPREFTAHGEQRYSLKIHPEGITLEVNRLRRSSQELHGELLVRVNGQFPQARTFGDGILQIGDMNFSSTTTRTSRAKLLADRAGEKNFDWYGVLEEFITEVIAAERKGKPAEVLADVEDEDEDIDAWKIEGFPLLQQLPQVIFGSGSAGKSFLALWLAGKLAESGINVLYADWEFSQIEHKKRLQAMFAPMPKNLLYIRCEHSLKHETDHLLDVIHKHKIQYIVCDSIGFACEGPAEASEGAGGYYRALRQLRIGSLNLAHTPKPTDDVREAQVFGSVFFQNGARSVWFISRASENPAGELRFGLYHRKSNVGALLQPKGFKLIFRGDRTLVEAINLKDVEELAAGYPLIDRMKAALVPGPMTIKGLAEELGAPIAGVRAILNRHRSHFVKIGNKVSVANAADPAPETPDDSGVEF